MDKTEQMASTIAMSLNGGEWKDGKWYSESHRKAWMDAIRPYAEEIENLRRERGMHSEYTKENEQSIQQL